MAKEVGPSLDLVYKRSNFASDEDFKKACKQPKVKKDKSVNQLYLERLLIFLNRKRTSVPTHWVKEEVEFSLKNKTLVNWP